MVSRAAGDQKRSNGQPVVVGVADHSGWAILVSVAAVKGEPTVVDRRRVTLIEKDVPNQPYHHETLALGEDEAEQLLRTVKRSIAACTAAAFDHLAADLSSHYRVSALSIRQATLEHLPATVREAHASYHTMCRADGMLYHSAICAAAGQRDWAVDLHDREALSNAASALPTMKAPWTADHRRACAAAMRVIISTPAFRKE